MLQYEELECTTVEDLIREFIQNKKPIFDKKYFIYSASCNDLLTFVREKKMINNLQFYISFEKVINEDGIKNIGEDIFLEYIKYTSSRKIFSIILLKEVLEKEQNKEELINEIKLHLLNTSEKDLHSYTLLYEELKKIVLQKTDYKNSYDVLNLFLFEKENQLKQKSTEVVY